MQPIHYRVRGLRFQFIFGRQVDEIADLLPDRLARELLIARVLCIDLLTDPFRRSIWSVPAFGGWRWYACLSVYCGRDWTGLHHAVFGKPGAHQTINLWCFLLIDRMVDA